MRSKPRRLGALRGKETEATRRTRINGVHKRLQSLPRDPTLAAAGRGSAHACALQVKDIRPR